MATVNVYLTFNGNCEEAFTFYKSVFGGNFPYVGRFGEMPNENDASKLSEEDKRKIMHISLPISKETMLYGSDILENQSSDFVIGNNFSLSLNVNSREEAESLFQSLSENGIITMPLEDTFWGAYFGMWRDKFGINWMINFDDPKDEIKL
ncbi:VOC family protein [Frigoriflavimonas asaccharolytica]|uniref:PhnB protein n=1 Tax=Frigoriflavimonas asaccharolytica TaxID=2735899 RepID=A0A8J8K7H0_9FLAO|nr:VOC family protein [Frigoriflavimonas asaccharolytica]NRS91998.1 PhnB protein [Frigoriflavimonas asaccharolytica]